MTLYSDTKLSRAPVLYCAEMARLARRLRANAVAIRNLPQVVDCLRGAFNGGRATGSGGFRAAKRLVGPSGDPRLLTRIAGLYLSELEREFCRSRPRCSNCPVRH